MSTGDRLDNIELSHMPDQVCGSVREFYLRIGWINRAVNQDGIREFRVMFCGDPRSRTARDLSTYANLVGYPSG